MDAVELPIILAIDTATKSCTVSLTRGSLEDGEVIASLILNNSITHSRKLLSAIDRLLSDTDTDWSMIGGLAIGLGPGSFTGLRIGMSTIKGIAAATNIPLYGVPTLDGIACSCVTDKLVCSVIDARKREVYAGFYRRNENGRLVRHGDIVVVSPEALAVEIDEPVLLVGDGVAAYKEKWDTHLKDQVEFAPSHLSVPCAANIGLLAHEQHVNSTPLDIAEASPLYVRASDAELSLGKK